MRRWSISFVAAVTLVTFAGNASLAQQSPDARSVQPGLAMPGAPIPFSHIKLDGVCADPLTRFCPALAATPGQTRNQVICLKPFRSSLPLSCRSAVTAAMR